MVTLSVFDGCPAPPNRWVTSISNTSSSIYSEVEGIFPQRSIRGTEDVLPSLRIAYCMSRTVWVWRRWFADWKPRRKRCTLRSAEVIPTPVVCSCRSPNDDEAMPAARACCSARDTAQRRRCSFPARRSPLHLAPNLGWLLRCSL